MRVEPSTALLAALHAERERMVEPLCAYFYDLGALADHVRATRAALPPNCDLFYAIKANAEPPVLQTLAPLVDGFEASSGGEIGWLAEHVPQKPVIMSGPGKLDEELRLALSCGVDLIHVESAGELARLACIARDMGARAPVALRVNLAIGTSTSTRLMMAGASPFGIDEEQVDQCVAYADSQPSLDLRGFHIHSLSHQLDLDAHLALIETYLDRMTQWRARYGTRIRHLNLGGGIGINYAEPERQADWSGFADRLGALIVRKGLQDLSLRFELGRYLSCASGFYAVEVIDLKQSHGQWFAVCRGGNHHFRTPSAQHHSHPLQIAPRSGGPVRDTVENAPVTFVGQLCTPKDRLAEAVTVDRLSVGDTVLFLLAGAYAWTISHHDFLRHPPPRMIFIPSPTPVMEDITHVHAAV